MNNQYSFEKSELGKLYLVPTPIGNLDDMTFRSIDVLKTVDLIAAEDTRHTQKLLNHFDIDTKMISFHEHNTQERIPVLLNKLVDKQSVAQVSDAGTPSISDPGSELVKAAVERGISVIPLPGANALVPALIASGIAPQPFYFHGFLPRSKNDLQMILEQLNQKTETMVFYESPHRLKKTLEQMNNIFGENRQITLARELTKKYEEFIRGNIKDTLKWVKDNQVRGEFVIIVEGNPNPQIIEKNDEWKSWSEKEHVERIIAEKNIRSKEAIKEVAVIRDVPKRQIYASYHEI